jgi:hypothetical protein
MDDELVKHHLHDRLRGERASMLWKLDGLSDYDVRRPLTTTGTSLLGLVKHLSVSEGLYFGDVFGRPFPERPRHWWDDETGLLPSMWAAADESRAEIVDHYRRAGERSDATIAALDLDAPGSVPWWPSPDVTLFNILVHVLAETSRHAGHADILREQLDGAVGTSADDTALQRFDAAFWADHRAEIEHAAEGADPRQAST